MRRAILGAAIGVGAGLAVVTLGVILSTGWLLVMIVPAAFPVMASAVTGLLIGWRNDRNRQPVARFWLWLTLAMVSWPFCALLPLWGRELQIRWMIARDIPVQPTCTLVEQRITPIGYDDPPGFFLRFSCSEKPETTVTYCRAELAKRGWEAMPSVRNSDYVMHQFRKRGRMLTFVSWSGSYPPDIRSRNWVQFHCCLSNFTYQCTSLVDLGYDVVRSDESVEQDFKPMESPK